MFTHTPLSLLLRFPGSLSLLVAAAACSAGTGDSDPDAGDGGNVTLDTLPADQRAAFEAWKTQPIKDCSWEEAFPGLAKEAASHGVPLSQATPRIDVAALYADTDGSPLLELAGGQIVLLGALIDDPSNGLSELNTTYTTDGRTARSLSVKAVRDRGDCVMTLGGQEVFSTRMTASMEITAFAAAGPPVLAGTDLTAAVFDPAHTVGAIDAAPLLKQALASLAPVEPAPAVLAARFHLDVAISARLFSLGDPQLPVTVRPQLADTPEFAPDAVMYGPSAAIAPLGDTTTVGLDLLFVPVVSGAPTADPDKLFVVRAEVAVGPQGRLAHATSLSVRPPIERSAAATFECFASRLHLANAFITTATPRLPGLDAVFSSCRDLVTNGFSALIDDPASRQLIARATFTGPTTRTTAYLGWDTAFLSVVDRLQSTGTDLATLDPDHSNAALDAALARATTLLRAVPSGAPAELRATVVPTSLRWALDGVSNLNELDRLIPATLANVGAVYPASVLRMLDDVTAGAPAGLAAARCGELLVGDRAVRVAATLARSAAIPEAANFTTALRNQMLQTCPDDATLARIDAAVDAARTFVAEDRARSTTATFDGSVKLFVNHTLRETWTTASYTALGDLLALAVLRRQGCASAPSYSEQVILCLNNHLERISTALGALLDPARVQRHVEFARALLPIRAGWLSDAAFVTVRSAFDAAFFDRALWFSCSDDGFKAAQTLLIETLDRLSTAAPTDQPDIEDEILAQLTATRCPASQVAAAQVR